MRKADVEFHGTNMDYNPVAAVNIKVPFRTVEATYIDFAEQERPDPRFTVDWLYEHESELEWTFEAACEWAWELFESDVREYIYPGAQLYTTGRSGGWAYVDGFTPEVVEQWDAIELGKWARFCKWARSYAEGVNYDMMSLAYLNVFFPWAEEQDKQLTGPTLEPVQ